MPEVKIYKTSEKILLWLHRNNKSMKWLANQLHQTRSSISQKIKNNMFTIGDINKLKNLGCDL